MDIVFRAAGAYVFIVFVLRVMGRRELSSLAPADLVLIVVLGDLIQNGVTQSDMSMTGVTIAISTFVLLTVRRPTSPSSPPAPAQSSRASP